MALALPAIAVALVGLLIAFAFFPLLRGPLLAVANAVPLIGGALVQAIDGATWWAYAQMTTFAAGAIRGMGEIWSIPTYNMHRLVDNAGAAAASAALAAWRVRWVTIPLLSSQLTSLAYWARDAAIQFAAQAEHDLEGLAWYLYNAAIAHADQWGVNLEGLDWTLYQWAIVHADTWGVNLQGLIWDRFNASVAEAVQLYNQSIAYTDTWGHNLEGLIWDRYYAGEQYAAAGIDALGRDLLRDLEQVQADSRAWADAAEAAGVAAAGVVARDLARLEEQPCIRYCSPLGGIGGLLQDLEDIGLLALLLGIAGEAARDPGAVLDDGRRLVVPVVQDLGRGVLEMAGLPAGGG